MRAYFFYSALLLAACNPTKTNGLPTNDHKEISFQNFVDSSTQADFSELVALSETQLVFQTEGGQKTKRMPALLYSDKTVASIGSMLYVCGVTTGKWFFKNGHLIIQQEDVTYEKSDCAHDDDNENPKRAKQKLNIVSRRSYVTQVARIVCTLKTLKFEHNKNTCYGEAETSAGEKFTFHFTFDPKDVDKQRDTAYQSRWLKTIKKYAVDQTKPDIGSGGLPIRLKDKK